ncbi:MAG: 30S ribosomal protein S6--L-glutamate ligase [Bacteroidia bacterium]|nr:30S ribosomal protein S6--L-glutamate ligase [Bacteroidia bacterium]MBT8308739.1 30S ribosomal protein S6--L-glutamate ligase [Bacteroidia bacterium]NNK26870.1 30S ribosomal protein S6--L-glutamate ligase [Flavobacteriaceae bacterium]NNL60775.1 30S ribosomal protein S6--L-glutamate ligase [Flavobacteriaceae bacterium]RZV68791.1 MAG: 30S ribosomal protein S6--L-glutamate ligase [Flavobacteriaceae bacterium]
MNIVILSRNSNLYSTARLIEEGEQRNHRMEVIDPLKCDLIIEREKPTIYYKDRYLDYVDAVIPRIGASVTFFGCAVVRQFEMMNIFATVTSDAIIRSRDKLRSFQRLSKAGIGMPKTVFTNYSRDVEEVIEHVGGTPVVIKLLEGTQGLGVVLCETRNAAESVLEAFNGLQARVVVQEYISEAKGADLRALVVDGKVVGAMKRQGKEGEFRSNLHRGGSAEYYELNDEEKKVALRASRALKLGVCGVDMLQSDRGPLLLEVNSTPGLQGIESATAQNIAGSIITYIERNRR